jgi:hypothetical protein
LEAVSDPHTSHNFSIPMGEGRKIITQLHQHMKMVKKGVILATTAGEDATPTAHTVS